MRKKIILVTIIFLALSGFLGWKLPFVMKMESLDLPEECETVYRTQIRMSDVYWLHIEGEKVIKCDLGYEAAKEYIELHNSEAKLTDIEIYEYAGMSDCAIYNSEFDNEFRIQPDSDNYIKIRYFKKL